MPSLAFEHYQEEVDACLVQIKEEMSETYKKKKDDDCSRMTEWIQQGQELCRCMALEARSCGTMTEKRELMDLVHAYETQLKSYEHQTELFSLSSEKEAGSDVQQQQQRPMDMLERQQRQLDRAHQSIAETEQVALDITNELADNRETIERSQGNIHSVQEMQTQAKDLLKSMMRKWF